ncbi:MAG: PorP/SprF family type IX secretion system membrane protein [Paludibacteraceae bacterium]|nr:PorP/SprF family type IX secretion system membrane protein [Paludibacteraceae bacterium]
MKKLSAFLMAASMSFVAAAQDIDYQLTGHSTSPFALNPSSVGEANAYRVGLNYRMQWPTLKNEYRTFRASYDQNFFKLVSSIGAHYVYDGQAKDFKSHEIGVTYAHNVRVVDGHYVRLGLTAAMFVKKLGEDIVFGDQWQNGSIADNSLEQDNMQDTQVFPDFSFGAQYVWENRLSAGAAIYHIAAPTYGFVDDDANQLNRRYSFHVRYLHNLESSAGLWGNRGKVENYVMGTLAYQHQGEYNVANVNVGAFVSHLMLGVAYRHDFRREVIGKLNTVSFMIGGNYKGLQAYYTYDLFTSQKSNGSWSHEFSIVYVFVKKHFRYSCPIVYW